MRMKRITGRLAGQPEHQTDTEIWASKVFISLHKGA